MCLGAVVDTCAGDCAAAELAAERPPGWLSQPVTAIAGCLATLMLAEVVCSQTVHGMCINGPECSLPMLYVVRFMWMYIQGRRYSRRIRHTNMTVVTGPCKPKHVRVSTAACVNDSEHFQTQDDLLAIDSILATVRLCAFAFACNTTKHPTDSSKHMIGTY